MPPNTETKDAHPQQETKKSTEETGGRDKPFSAQHALHGTTGQSWVSHVGPPLFLFFLTTNKPIEKVAWALCSGISHIGNIRYDHATETEIVVLLLVRYFLGDRIFSMKRQR
jgi:hypothetical protein